MWNWEVTAVFAGMSILSTFVGLDCLRTVGIIGKVFAVTLLVVAVGAAMLGTLPLIDAFIRPGCCMR